MFVNCNFVAVFISDFFKLLQLLRIIIIIGFINEIRILKKQWYYGHKNIDYRREAYEIENKEDINDERR